VVLRHESDQQTTRRPYELTDRYRRDDGTVFLSGVQALARLPYEQLRVDRAAGWNTAAYVTGYQGSPLAGYDRDITAVVGLAEADGLRVVFQPGLNEELAATAVMGSQLSVTLQSCRYDGVLGIWYGKAPGLDRASDAIRHAVFAGTSSRGGAVALVGDDPSAKSSTLPSSSDATLVDLHIPVLFPGDVQQAVDLGRHAVALSRASGLWAAIKVVESVADGTGTVELHPDRIVPIIPTIEVDGTVFVPRPSGRLVTPHTLELEREFHEVRLELARKYGELNGLNRISLRGPHDWIGIVASGNTYHEMREALHVLGLRTDDDVRDAGIRLLELGMPIPLDPGIIRVFAEGLAEIVVVEDKNPTLEWAVKEALYAQAVRPVISGKRAPDGSPMLPPTGALSADLIGPQLRARLLQRLSPDRLRPDPADVHAQRIAVNGDGGSNGARQLIPLSINRTPFFCSGCPHNTSTRVPDDSLVGGGIGCHTMVMLMDPGRFGNIVGVTAMGNEGAQWFGMAPFVGEQHLFQNIGDGTLFHSGMLAVRAAVANGANITYKVLYNGTVAMTGGQDPFGQLEVANLARVFLAEGVKRVIVTTDDLDRYRSVSLPPDVDLLDRSRLIDAQQTLAATPGTTVLIHDQRCAAELRRDRKRRITAAPAWRVVISERVCEGCGDCGDVSNCLSVQAVETPFGRKTRIDQGTCNLDASCVKGDCPSFMTVTPSRRHHRAHRKGAASSTNEASSGRSPTIDMSMVADPTVIVDTDDCTVRLSGIGGTGVVTVSQVLGTAAMLDGFQVRGLDQTGLSQKAGPVVSDVRLTRARPKASNRATNGSVDALLAFDLLVAASDTHIAGASPDRTMVVASSSAVATGSMVLHPERDYPLHEAEQRLRSSSRSLVLVDALGVTSSQLGDSATANIYVLGVAVQRGIVPVHPERIEAAIGLNGVSVDKNLAAFRLGRSHAAGVSATAPQPIAEALDQLVGRLADDLRGYQSSGYAKRFLGEIDRVRACGSDEFTRAVAVSLHKLMAYKDEYEVARLLLSSETRQAAEAVGGPGAKVQWNLHPPMLRSLGMHRKLRLGRWATPLLAMLRGAKRVRGTPLDPFGFAKVRRIERALVGEYLEAIHTLVQHFAHVGADSCVAIAQLPDGVRGYESLKLRRVEAYRLELAERMARLGTPARR
jgi:indolepyruvate ferredoxin oxidoreductase